MSNRSMSPPQKPAPHMASPPYSGAGSPVNPSPYGQPPAKRQRLSPDPRSPPNGASPYMSNPHGMPMSYGNPYAPQAQHSPYNQASPSTFAGSPQGSFNTPQPYQPQLAPWQHSQPSTPATGPNRQMSPQNSQMQSSQMMPPPPRPNKEEKEERVGVDEIGDSLFGSGINIKDEENYLHSTFNNRHGVNDSFGTNQSTSFGSTTVSPNNSFNLLTQSTSFSSQPSGALAGTMEQQPRSQEDIEREVKGRREQAARDRNERLQHHLNNQFLMANGVRNRLDKRAHENGVQWNVAGLYRRQEQPHPQTHTMVNGANTEGIAAQTDTRPEYTVERNSHADQLLTLVGLATGERLRSLMSEAYALARARRYGDHGRVPPEFADIAVGGGKKVDEKVVPENITGSEWDRLPNDDHAMTNGDSEKPATPQAQPTISFQSAVAARLREVADRDRKAEQERVRKREARRRAASENPTAGESETPADSTSAPETPADAAAPVKVSKKEQAKREKEAKNSSEAQLHVTTNQTAAMMALGKKGSRYSWMSGAGSAPLVNRFQKTADRANAAAAGSGTATPTPGVAGASGVKSPGAAAMARGASENGASRPPQWGEWREDAGAGGKGIQARDWILVLERDGKEKLALQRVLNKLQ